MRNVYVLIGSLLIAISMISGCNKNDDISTLYDQKYIENKYQDLKSGYLQITEDKVSFQEAIFDYDDKAIMYVKEYIDEDFNEYDLSDNPEIYIIEFEDFETKYKKVGYEFFTSHFKDYSSRPFYVEITDNKITAIIEIYVP